MSDARFLVLVSLSDGARHGYWIQQDIAAFAGVHLGPGTLYGAINSLERDQLIERLPSTQRRHPYRLTADGRRQLRQQLRALERIQARTAAVKLA
jgi:DNA-binding PadR family transcriptional regulator